MRQPRGTETDLRDLGSVALFQQHVLARNFKPVELELAMPAVFVRRHDRDTPNDAPARLILMVEECSQPTALVV